MPVLILGRWCGLQAVRAATSSAKCTGYQRILGDHIGDWEHLEIRFDTSGKAPRPTSIYLAAHNGGANFTWGDPTIQLYQATHPVVFSANGSHGKLLQFENCTVITLQSLMLGKTQPLRI